MAKLTDQVEQLTVEIHAHLLQKMKVHVQQYTYLALPLDLPEVAPEGNMTAQEHFA